MKFTKFALVAALALGVGSAQALTDEQQAELWDTGTITIKNDDGSVKGHFEVTIAPGCDDIDAARERALKRSLDIIDDLIDQKFWDSVIKPEINKGRKFFKDGVDNGVFMIDDDYRATKETNKKTHGKWGHQLHSLTNWLKFAEHAVERVGHTVVSSVCGTYYTVCVPAGRIFMVPVNAGKEFFGKAVFTPAKAYAWQAGAWVLLRDEDQPKAGDMFVTFVPVHPGATTQTTPAAATETPAI